MTALIPIKQILLECLEDSNVSPHDVTEVSRGLKKPATNHAGRVLSSQCDLINQKVNSEHDGSKSHDHRPGFPCPACEDAKARYMQTTPEQFPELPFQIAAESWLKEHARYIKPRTLHDYQQYLKPLIKFFWPFRLKEIGIHHLRAYQDERGNAAGATRINMELSTLQQILKEARLWQNFQSLYKPLPVSNRGAGRSASKEEQDKLLEIAFRSRRRLLAAHCIRIMFRCGVGFGELRMVRRRDVDLKEHTFLVMDGAKNHERERNVPLGEQAYESMGWIIDRWVYLGGKSFDQFILPHCSSEKNGPRDFNRPMLSIKKAWAGIRAEAIKEIGPHMEHFRIYDCRVTAVTKALASGKVPIHTAEKLFGHVSQAMQRRYYKPQIDTLREATKVLEDKA